MKILGGTLAILVATTLVAAPSIARGATRPVDISWSAPEECPTKDQFETSLAPAKGGDRAASTLPPLRVSLSVTKQGRLYTLVLTTPTSPLRTFEGATCDEVVDAASLVLAMQLDNELVTAEAPPPPVPPKDTEPPIEKPTPSTASGEPPTWFARASLLVDLGTLRGAALGAESGLGVDVDRLRMEGAVGTFFPHTVQGSSRALGAHAVYGRARLSWRIAGNSLAIRPFVTFDYTYGRAESDGNAFVRSTSATWTSLGAGAIGEWRVSKAFAFQSSLEGLVPLARPELGLPALSLSLRPEPAAFRALLGAQVYFL